MKATHLFKVPTIFAGFFVVLLLTPGISHSQTPGGSIVLAKCNSWVSFNVTKYSGEIVITNICANSSYKAMVDITIGSRKTTEQIPFGQSIVKGGWSATTTIKIVNIEKGNSSNTCDGRGPKDSDVRVLIPGSVTSISKGNMVTGTTCSVCGANFDPITQ